MMTIEKKSAILENFKNEIARAYPNKNQDSFTLGYIIAFLSDVMTEEQAKLVVERTELLRERANKK